MMKKFILKNQHLLFPFFDIALNGFNYFFHVFISWYLIPSDYGILNSLLSFSAILFVAGIAFQTYTAKTIASDELVDNKLLEIFKVCLVFFIITLSLLTVLTPFIKKITRADTLSVVLIVVTFTINILLSIFRGIFQGQKEFLNLNISFYIEVVSKILFLVLLLPMFPNLNSALLAILFGMLLSFIHALYKTKSHPKSGLHVLSKSIELKQSAKQLIKIYIANFFFYFFTSIDMIMVNYHLPNVSGVYAVMLKYSQILLFVCLSLITVFLPTLSHNKNNRAPFIKTIFMFFGIIFSVSLIAFLGYQYVAPPTVGLFFGQEYVAASQYLAISLIPYVFLVSTFFVINLHIILENSHYLISLFIFSIIITLLLHFFHQNIQTILFIETINYLALFITLLLQFIISYKRRQTK